MDENVSVKKCGQLLHPFSLWTWPPSPRCHSCVSSSGGVWRASPFRTSWTTGRTWEGASWTRRDCWTSRENHKSQARSFKKDPFGSKDFGKIPFGKSFQEVLLLKFPLVKCPGSFFWWKVREFISVKVFRKFLLVTGNTLW